MIVPACIRSEYLQSPANSIGLRLVLPGLVLGLGLILAGASEAQVLISADLTTDYQYRAVSLSDGRAALSLNLAYDHSSGLYASASAIGEDTTKSGLRMLGYVETLGLARRIGSRLSWDVGLRRMDITQYGFYTYKLHDTQLYAGLRGRHLSGYLAYAPNYYGSGISTLYADVTGDVPLTRRLRLFGHAGALTPLSGQGGPGSYQEAYDLRAGVAAHIQHLEVQLAWSRALPVQGSLAGYSYPHHALTLTTSVSF